VLWPLLCLPARGGRNAAGAASSSILAPPFQTLTSTFPPLTPLRASRDYGIFHGITHNIGTHVVHHLFPQVRMHAWGWGVGWGLQGRSGQMGSAAAPPLVARIRTNVCRQLGEGASDGSVSLAPKLLMRCAPWALRLTVCLPPSSSSSFLLCCAQIPHYHLQEATKAVKPILG